MFTYSVHQFQKPISLSKHTKPAILILLHDKMRQCLNSVYKWTEIVTKKKEKENIKLNYP